jgi:hypothetical protein
MARHVPATENASAMPHPATLEAVLARWLDGETLDLTSELRKAASAARGDTPGADKQFTHWNFLADF